MSRAMRRAKVALGLLSLNHRSCTEDSGLTSASDLKCAASDVGGSQPERIYFEWIC